MPDEARGLLIESGMFASLSFLAPRPHRPTWRARARLGLTLIEVMISLGVLVITSVGGVSAFMLLNRWASNTRNITAAKELCQERIEQVETMPFVPTKSTPFVTGQTVNSVASGPFKILGNAYTDAGPNYDINGLLTASATTSTEPVNIYLRQDNGVNVVAGTRTTSIALPTNLVDTGAPSKGQLPAVQFTVTVAYTYRGQNYSYSMYTIRSAD